MRSSVFFFLFLPLLVLSQTGCIRPCQSALDRYAVYSHDFGDIEQVILGPDGSVALAGNHIYSRRVPDPVLRKYVKEVTEKRSGFVVGSGENMQNRVRQVLFTMQGRQGVENPRVLKMAGYGYIINGWHSIDKSCFGGKGYSLDFEPWKSIVDRSNAHPPQVALLPGNLRNGSVHSVREGPFAYTLDGRTVQLDFSGNTSEIQDRCTKWWGPVLTPVALVSDTAASVAFFGWTVALLPVAALPGPAYEFLWPVPFYNTFRKSKGLEPVKWENIDLE